MTGSTAALLLALVAGGGRVGLRAQAVPSAPVRDSRPAPLALETVP